MVHNVWVGVEHVIDLDLVRWDGITCIFFWPSLYLLSFQLILHISE
jgi:hypothetical protein